MDEKTKHITSIGGQAIIEGVMMRGPHKTAMAIRKPDGEIIVEVNENGTKKHNKFLMLPVIRGCVNFFDSMVIGMKALMFSADFMDIEGDEEEYTSKFDKWLFDKFGDKVKDIVVYTSLVLSLFMSVGLFILLPTAVTKGIEAIFMGKTLIPISPDGFVAGVASTQTFTSFVEGILRMGIFLLYLALVAKMKDIQRVFEYHGAEHKSISCYEAGEELTVENVRKHSRFHPRCGTSFLLFVMIISIILFSLLPRTGIIIRMAMRLALLPLVAGLSYEVIKLAGRSKNKCVIWLTKPGLWLQKLTTREPDNSQIEVAIESIKSVIPDNKEEDKW